MKLMPKPFHRALFGFLAAALIGGLFPQQAPPAYAHHVADLRVWRVQITIRVADVSNAGTDDSVNVQLNSSNRTWLNYARDDFERNSSFTYDLNQTAVARLGDINMIRIEKTGSDGLCLRSFTLLVNGRSAFTRNFGSTSSTCQWLDNEDGRTRSFTVNAAALATAFESFIQPAPSLRIPRAEIESRVESMVGHHIHGTDLYWGHLSGRGVEASRRNTNTVHVDLDLAYRVPVWWDPEVDVDFDLEFTCSAGRINVRTTNVRVDVDSSFYSEILSLGLIENLDDYLTSQIQRMWPRFSTGTEVGLGDFCPRITVEDDGDVVFSL